MELTMPRSVSSTVCRNSWVMVRSDTHRPNLAEMIPTIKSHIEISGVISGEVDVVSLQRVTFSPGDKVTFMKASVTL